MGKIVIYHAHTVSKLFTILSLLRDVVVRNTGLSVEIAHQDNLATALTDQSLTQFSQSKVKSVGNLPLQLHPVGIQNRPCRSPRLGAAMIPVFFQRFTS